MRRRVISWGLALGLGLPGGVATVSSARAEVSQSAGTAAKKAGDAAKQADEAAAKAEDAAKSADKAAEQAGEAADTATSHTADKASEKASSTTAKGKDARIEEAVEHRLDRGDMDEGVEVQAKNGVVTLTGTIDSEDMRERIVDTAAKTDGVKDVNDHLKVDAVQREGETPERR